MIDHANPLPIHRSSTPSSLRRLLFSLAACAGTLVWAMTPLGCATEKKFEMPRSASDQLPLNERIKKAYELADAAQNAKTAGNPAKAIDLYRQSIQVYREFPAAWLNLGVLHMEAKNNLEAVDAFNVASELDPDDPRPFYNIAIIWDEKHYYKEAIKHYNLALEKNPNLIEALRRSIYLEMQTNSFTPASKDRVMRALMIEKDPLYINVLSQAKIRIDNEVLAGDTSPGN